MSLKSTIINALRPYYFPVMCSKLISRFVEHRRRRDAIEAEMWCKAEAVDYQEYARQLDSGLWAESAHFAQECESVAKDKLNDLDIDLGGGANYPFLYFLVRFHRPDTVVETGVAAGFSSYAILAAMNVNNQGTLYSSDFPYFRLKNPEQYIGYVVPNELKTRWRLFTRGDRRNIKQITEKLTTVDLLHYDSDKSYSGREFVLSALTKVMSKNPIVMMDDIQDNLFFRDFVTKQRLQYHIFEFGGKYVGVIGI